MAPFAALTPALLLFRSLRTRVGIAGDTAAFYLAVTAGVFAAALTSEALHASATNVLLLPCTWLLILFVVSGEGVARLGRRHGDQGLQLMMVTVCLAQFLALAYVPSRLVGSPDEPTGVAGITLVTISGDLRLPGNVHTRLHVMPLENVAYADSFAVGDLLNGASPAVTQMFERSVRSSICGATPLNPVVLDGEVARFGSTSLVSPAWACR